MYLPYRKFDIPTRILFPKRHPITDQHHLMDMEVDPVVHIPLMYQVHTEDFPPERYQVEDSRLEVEGSHHRDQIHHQVEVPFPHSQVAMEVSHQLHQMEEEEDVHLHLMIVLQTHIGGRSTSR